MRLESLWGDIRFAFRIFKRSPARLGAACTGEQSAGLAGLVPLTAAANLASLMHGVRSDGYRYFRIEFGCAALKVRYQRQAGYISTSITSATAQVVPSPPTPRSPKYVAGISKARR
jgi:hypothetical protein